MSVSTPYALFPPGRLRIAMIATILIVGISYGLFFYLQSVTERNLRDSLFEQQRQRQMQATRAIAQHVESDLSSIVANLRALSVSIGMVDGTELIDSQAARKAANDTFYEINSGTDPVSRKVRNMTDDLYIVDKNGIIRVNIVSPGMPNFVGTNLSSRDYLKVTESRMDAVFSNGFVGLDGNYRIAITYPIEDPKTQRYLGLAAVTMPTATFFRNYGNTYDIQSQYLAVLDTGGVQLVHPVQSLVGTEFFGDYTQNQTGRNKVLNSLISTVMSGKPETAVYEFRNGERLNTGYPVFLEGRPTYFIFVITPTSAIYSSVNDILLVQRTETFSLLAGMAAAIVVLIIFLVKWNGTLEKAVKDRTSKLAESNRQLAFVNERLIAINEKLEASEKMEKEFVNIAAHELRTPIQPILGLTEILQQKVDDPELKSVLETIQRNARRLQQLANDILDVTRIESQSLKLTREVLDINQIVVDVVHDFKSRLGNGGSLRIETSLSKPTNGKLLVYGDRQRLYQVVSNILDNSTKFTDQGTILVSTDLTSTNGGQVLVSVRDTGSGIDREVMPRLFTKFVSKSDKGTGLGLFIAKSIVEAHGGKIWAGNNPDTKGATVSFSLAYEKNQDNIPEREQTAQTENPRIR